MRSTRGKARIAWTVVALGLAAGCSNDRPAGEARSLVRLVDLAGRDAIVESPLLSLGPASEPLGELSTRRLWGGSFDEGVLGDLGWEPVAAGEAGVVLQEDPERGPIVCFRGGRVWTHPILVAARPLARYRVTRVWKSERRDLDLRVVESAVQLIEPAEVNGQFDLRRMLRGRFLAKEATPAVHRFSAGSGPGGGSWERSTVDFTASLDTNTLAVLFERVSEPGSAEACLAEVTIERVEATPAQELALLARAWTRPEADVRAAGEAAAPDLGVAKRGSLLPVRRLRATKPPYDENYEHRDALFAPAPTTLRFPVHVPAGGRFTFSYALARGSDFGDAASFEVVVGAGGEETRLFAETVTIGARGEGWHWRQAAVALDRWAGRRVDLELRTSSSTERGFALWGNPMVDAPRGAAEPPNVVLIGVDTLRADRLSSYGYERATTPHLDRLAAEGVRFDQAVSTSNWTAPAFASIFSGLSVSRHGVVNNELAMSDRVETLAEHLRAGGWRTHAIAYKAFLFGLGLDQGFDRWFNLPTSGRTAEANLGKALAWLEKHHDRRFFLFLHLDDPHQPFNQPVPFDLRFGDARAHEELGFALPIGIRPNAVEGCRGCYAGGRPRPEFVPVAQALYDGAVAYTDDRIGALLDQLRDYGIYDDTVVAMVADHGEVIYDREDFWGHGAELLTDELVRVPLILKPARGRPFEPGLVVREQVRVTDLLPTLLEAVGQPAGRLTDEVDARSLWPLIDRAAEEERVAFLENPVRGVVGVRTRDWKYVVRSQQSGCAIHRLFDLRADPGELVDLARQRPRELARMGDLLAAFLLRTRPGPFLLALGDGETAEYQLDLETGGDGSVRSLVGLAPAGAGDAAVGACRGAPGGRVIALVELDLRPGRAVRAALASGDRIVASRTAAGADLVSYAAGTLERLAALPTPALYFLAGAPPIDAERAAATTTLDQLEDLKALGYIE